MGGCGLRIGEGKGEGGRREGEGARNGADEVGFPGEGEGERERRPFLLTQHAHLGGSTRGASRVPSRMSSRR